MIVACAFRIVDAVYIYIQCCELLTERAPYKCLLYSSSSSSSSSYRLYIGTELNFDGFFHSLSIKAKSNENHWGN